MNTPNPGRIVQSSSLTLDIVDTLVELEGARITEVAEHLDVSKASVANHCHTLRRKGFVVPRGDEFYPSLKFAYIGEHAKRQDRAYELAAEITYELDEVIPFETTFIVEENCIGRYLTPEEKQSGKHDQFAFTGEEEHLHTLAAGKTILASVPQKYVNQVLDQRGLPQKTGSTITDRDELLEELEQIREQGYAVNRQENRDEIYAIAKAVQKPDRSVLGAMSILTPVFRLKEDDFDEEVYNILFQHVNELERRIKSSLSIRS